MVMPAPMMMPLVVNDDAPGGHPGDADDGARQQDALEHPNRPRPMDGRISLFTCFHSLDCPKAKLGPQKLRSNAVWGLHVARNGRPSLKFLHGMGRLIGECLVS
jgi:hypothetical protein